MIDVRGVWDWLALLFLLAGIYVLVRPRSPAAELVDVSAKAMIALVRRATDLAKT